MDQEDELSTVSTRMYTPEETRTDSPPAYSPPTVPRPGAIFIIKSTTCGRVLTLQDNQVTLANPSNHISIHWTCVETKGWLGFRNVVSGKFLGHDWLGNLCCGADHHQGWENFCVRPRADGAYTLLMAHWDALWHIGIQVEDDGSEKLVKLAEGGDRGVAWEFIETHGSGSVGPVRRIRMVDNDGEKG